jgi:hypothetical protein
VRFKTLFHINRDGQTSFEVLIDVFCRILSSATQDSDVVLLSPGTVLQNLSGGARMTSGSRHGPARSSQSRKADLEWVEDRSGVDPRLIQLVHLLARRAAQKAYVEMPEERRTPRS